MGDTVSLILLPITLKEARSFVDNFHRHNKPPQGGKWAIGASDETRLVGVAIVRRPIARKLDDSLTAEVTRCCVLDDAPKNTCSFLYGRCWRIWQQMGGKRMVTYTLASESGASLKGAGWKMLGETKPSKKDSGWMSRNRDWHPIYGQMKFRWGVEA